jgi:dTDP-4-amino-4,6-dideoxygalactose transaminase
MTRRAAKSLHGLETAADPTPPDVATPAPVASAHAARRIPVAKPRLPTLAAIAPYIECIDEARWYSNFGPLCQEFETRLAERYGVERDGVSTISNATIGLTLALKATGAPAGSLCIVPSWTFSASVHAVAEAGLTPLFVDVDREGLLTPQIVRQAIAAAPGEVSAVLPVAYCGQPIDPQPWDDFAAESGIAVVLDIAPGFDAARAGHGLTAVSLHATKVLGVGEGGFVMSRSPELVAATRLRANFGFSGSRIAQVVGTNGKLSEYAAALGLAGLDEWPARQAAFRRAALRYCMNLVDQPVTLPHGWGVSWQSTTCVVRLVDPSRLAPVLDALHRAGVETRAWWGRGMHTHPAFADYPRLALHMTGQLAETTLGLPFFIDMTDDEIDLVCQALREGLARCC